MNITRLCTIIATLGPVGYFGASGTVATILTLPLVYGLHALFPIQRMYLVVAVAFYALGIFIVKRALRYIKRHDDPSEIVLDEVVGCIFVFWGIALSATAIVVGTILFRAFDIIKFGLVKRAESWAHAWGVMGDDLVAALITNIILRILVHSL
jgi:phosphatidylglycerophosphatase A